MSRLDTQIGKIQRFFESPPGEVFLPDLCDFLEAGTVSDGMSGNTLEDDEILLDVSCRVDELSEGVEQTLPGGTTVVARHRITTPVSDEALALSVDGKIRVQARGDIPERLFEYPIRAEQSLTAMVEFRAVLVKHGYQPIR